MAERACPGCGMPESNWQTEEGHRGKNDGKTYCCEGCAEERRCTCGIKVGIGV